MHSHIRITFMRYSLFAFLAFLLFFGMFALAQAQDAGINANLPGSYSLEDSGPVAIVANFYEFALMAAGILAFGAIVYGALRRVTSVGNPSAISEANDWITSALLGLLLLLGAYLVLNTINPELVTLELPRLEKVGGIPPSGGGVGASATSTQPKSSYSCQEHQQEFPNAQSCRESDALIKVVECVVNKTGVNLTTVGGSHAKTSCHFGGTSCTDGGHAFDAGITASRARAWTLLEMTKFAEACGKEKQTNVQCFYEDSAGKRYAAYTDPAVNHIHCNVDTAACGCN